MALKSIMILHQGKIQHISPDELKKGVRIEKEKKKRPSLLGRNKMFYDGKLRVKCIKA